MKQLLLIALTSLFSFAAQAGPTCAEYEFYKSIGTDWPYATPMSDFANQCRLSKVPKKRQPEFKCKDIVACTKIDSVEAYEIGESQGFLCKSESLKFDCSKIVYKYGERAVGMSVEVKIQTYDMCHQAGACGQRACRPASMYGEAFQTVTCAF